MVACAIFNTNRLARIGANPAGPAEFQNRGRCEQNKTPKVALNVQYEKKVWPVENSYQILALRRNEKLKATAAKLSIAKLEGSGAGVANTSILYGPLEAGEVPELLLKNSEATPMPDPLKV